MRKQLKAKEVAAELLPGASTALLQELSLLTREGDLNADSRRKLKQVNHFLGLLKPGIEDLLARYADPILVDCAAGKGYLGFLLCQLFLMPAGKGTLLSVESRPELAAAGEARAKRLGIGRIRFLGAEVEKAELPAHVQLVTALHACDTATDDALLRAVAANADHIAVVPCCQAEVARQLEAAPAGSPFAPLFEHPWHRREFGSHLTNVIRALFLETKGYRVTVTELTGWEHSLKNELILAKRTHGRDARAEERLAALLASTGVTPKVVRVG